MYSARLIPIRALFFRNLYGPATERVSIVRFYADVRAYPTIGPQCCYFPFHTGEYSFGFVLPRQRYEISDLQVS